MTEQSATHCYPGTCVIDYTEIMMLIGAVDEHSSTWITFDLSDPEPKLAHYEAPAKCYHGDIIVNVT